LELLRGICGMTHHLGPLSTLQSLALLTTYSLLFNSPPPQQSSPKQVSSKYESPRKNTTPITPEEYKKEFNSPNRDFKKVVEIKVNVAHIVNERGSNASDGTSVNGDCKQCTLLLGDDSCDIDAYGNGRLIGKIERFHERLVRLRYNSVQQGLTEKIGTLRFQNNRLVLVPESGFKDNWGKWSFQYVTNGPDLKLEMILCRT